MLPPNEFICPYSKEVFVVDNVLDARWQYRTRMSMHCHKYKRRKHIDGALYSDIFMDNAEIIDIKAGHSVDIVIQLGNGMTTTVTAFVDIDDDNKHLQNCKSIAQMLSRKTANTFRKRTSDKGNMYVVGNGRKGDGSSGTYQLTNIDGVRQLLRELTISAEYYYRKNHLSHHIDMMRSKKNQNSITSMKGAFVCSVATSHNLKNAAHYDVYDTHHSIVTWTKDDHTTLDFWYFILPNVTRDNKRALVIKVKHGLTISLDAKKVMHCSTYKSNCYPCDVYGTAFFVNN